MSQHDYVIDNQSFPQTRADWNALADAVKTSNSGLLEPTTTAPFMPWFDTTLNVLKIRNADDTAWLTEGTARYANTGTAAGEIPLNSDLPVFGTAAAADVTTSTTDNTAGRLVKVGDDASVVLDVSGIAGGGASGSDVNRNWTSESPATFTTGTDNVQVGYQGGGSRQGTNSVFVGSKAGSQTYMGTDMVAIGHKAMELNTGSAIQAIAIGSNAIGLATNVGRYCIGIGGYSLKGATGYENVAVGFNAGNKVVNGAYNTLLGTDAGQGFITANYVTAVGMSAIGFTAADAGHSTTAVGSSCLYRNEANYNTALGAQAGYNLSAGSYNLFLGFGAALSTNGSYGCMVFGGYTDAGSKAPVFEPNGTYNTITMGSTAVTEAHIQVAWTVVSDKRDKTNFAPVPHGLDFVSKLKPTAFQFKKDRESEETNGGVRYGFLAQDIAELEGSDPIIVDTTDPEKFRYNESSMIPVLVNAIQEMKQEIDDLVAEIKTLRGL